MQINKKIIASLTFLYPAVTNTTMAVSDTKELNIGFIYNLSGQNKNNITGENFDAENSLGRYTESTTDSLDGWSTDWSNGSLNGWSAG
jgi:hypothetical protein